MFEHQEEVAPPKLESVANVISARLHQTQSELFHVHAQLLELHEANNALRAKLRELEDASTEVKAESSSPETRRSVSNTE